MDLIAVATPFFLLAIAAELVWGIKQKRNTYRLNDAFSSLMLGILSQARKLITLGVGGAVYYWVTETASLSLLASDDLMTWVIAFVVYDFCYYWLHRMGHEWQLLWAAHVAHHQSEDYNLSTALRQTSTGFLLGWVFYLPLFVLGVPAEVVVTVGALNLIYQFWVHTQHIPELGPLEWVLVTPSNHRVHHAQNDCYLDRNYGGVFIFWDRLFGTYQRELESVPCIYGIRGPIRSWNPVVALTHVYRDMWRDMRHSASWQARLKVLFARPGWQPAEAARIDPRPKSDLRHFERFDPPTTQWVRYYAGSQLLLATILLIFTQLNPVGIALGWGVWAFLLLTGVTTAWWLEDRAEHWLRIVDLARLALLAAAAQAFTGIAWGFAIALVSGVGVLLLLVMSQQHSTSA
ncbi:sterol desaturase family protein [Luminiphilus syltensis]|uniref:sterol desaturase family protein n=1 Tax=Luminiphilus syltensis TaxID=1341119 RepID=UPI0003071352|nr:sterol desaturase family protein [Luminiphilus syltensis]